VATRRTAKAAPKAKRAAAPALPDPGGDAPLQELSRDALSVFLFLALLPEETRAIVKELGISVPGFRTEALGDVERCDVLADEIRASPGTRRVVLDALRKAFDGLPLARVPLDADGAGAILELGGSDHGLTLALWRVLADPAPGVRGRAGPVLERMVAEYYGPREGGAAPPLPAVPERAAGAAAEARIADLERELERARARAEDARARAEGEREKLRTQLKEARAREAQAVDDAARTRDSAAEATRAREKAEAALAAARATDAAAEAHRARAAARELEGRVASLEARLARAGEREAELQQAIRDARERPSVERPQPVAAAASDDGEPEEAPGAWLMPVFTREFYDSLEGWDRRVQRSAFKQAFLLAQDHRHPSLRALPLEGLPGYYRVRVATDVRLLYRRGERQDAVEILSLIDREDLDRYIKQAKTR